MVSDAMVMDVMVMDAVVMDSMCVSVYPSLTLYLYLHRCLYPNLCLHRIMNLFPKLRARGLIGRSLGQHA